MQFLLEVVDILTNYVRKTFDRSTKVLDFHHPHQLLEGMEGFNLELSDQPESLEQILVDCRDTLKYGVRTGTGTKRPRRCSEASLQSISLISLHASVMITDKLFSLPDSQMINCFFWGLCLFVSLSLAGHPRFFNQLSTGLDIVGLAGEWLTSTANTNM